MQTNTVLRRTPCGEIRGLCEENGTLSFRGVCYAVAGRWEYPTVVTH